MKLKLGDLVMEEPFPHHRWSPEIGIVVEIEGWNVSVLIGGEIKKIASFCLKLLSPADAPTPSEG